ncbi:MAG TPA: MFS transporter [Solirubrobacteraceae bacterium]|nr:MFS transporter [Solirubrobacteraceae bacterium]
MASTTAERSGGRALRTDERARLAILALPTTALALSITIVSTYLGEITRRYTQQTVVIGLIIGSEGIMALWVPLIAGAWSDALRTPIGGRLPFVLAGGLPAAGVLVLIGVLHSLIAVAIAAAAFFALYFVAYEPYRALYPDLVDGEEIAGRAQSTQAVARGLGTGLALLGGGVLLSLARWAPFAVAALILVIAIVAFSVLLLRRGTPPQTETTHSLRAVVRQLIDLVRDDPRLRCYLVANALWETALSALKAFVILYVTVGLGYSLSTGSLLVGGVALVILIGAAGAGKAADRYGRLRILQHALVAYGAGFLVLVFTTNRALIAVAIPFIAVGGGTVMTLAYAVLMPMMPEDEHGALTGFYSLSRGIGIVTGPVLAGLLISLTQHGPFSATQGFQSIWLVCAAAALGSWPLVRRMRRLSGDEQDDA